MAEEKEPDEMNNETWTVKFLGDKDIVFKVRIPEEGPQRYVLVDEEMLAWIKENALGDMTWWHPMNPFFNGEEGEDGNGYFEIKPIEQFEELPHLNPSSSTSKDAKSESVKGDE